jgi:squalene synthase HpnC
VSAVVLSIQATGESAVAPTPQQVMAQAGAENFPVASRLLPADVRAHLLALYGFARLVDDIGDEIPGDRLELLDALELDLERAFTGMPGNPLLIALKPTIEQCALPIEPFKRLIEANRRDQLARRYRTFDDLLDYCALSANPVGELVLHVFGAATADRIRLSDHVCTGLQLVEHWQDVAEDYARGRIYLPADDRERFGVSEEQLGASASTATLRHLLAFEVARARELLDRGAPLIKALDGRPKLAVAAFVAGGRAALDAIERGGFDVLGARPRPGVGLKLKALLATLLGRSALR